MDERLDHRPRTQSSSNRPYSDAESSHSSSRWYDHGPPPRVRGYNFDYSYGYDYSYQPTSHHPSSSRWAGYEPPPESSARHRSWSQVEPDHLSESRAMQARPTSSREKPSVRPRSRSPVRRQPERGSADQRRGSEATRSRQSVEPGEVVATQSPPPAPESRPRPESRDPRRRSGRSKERSDDVAPSSHSVTAAANRPPSPPGHPPSVPPPTTNKTPAAHAEPMKDVSPSLDDLSSCFEAVEARTKQLLDKTAEPLLKERNGSRRNQVESVLDALQALQNREEEREARKTALEDSICWTEDNPDEQEAIAHFKTETRPQLEQDIAAFSQKCDDARHHFADTFMKSADEAISGSRAMATHVQDGVELAHAMQEEYRGAFARTSKQLAQIRRELSKLRSSRPGSQSHHQASSSQHSSRHSSEHSARAALQELRSRFVHLENQVEDLATATQSQSNDAEDTLSYQIREMVQKEFKRRQSARKEARNNQGHSSSSNGPKADHSASTTGARVSIGKAPVAPRQDSPHAQDNAVVSVPPTTPQHSDIQAAVEAGVQAALPAALEAALPAAVDAAVQAKLRDIIHQRDQELQEMRADLVGLIERVATDKCAGLDQQVASAFQRVAERFTLVENTTKDLRAENETGKTQLRAETQSELSTLRRHLSETISSVDHKFSMTAEVAQRERHTLWESVQSLRQQSSRQAEFNGHMSNVLISFTSAGRGPGPGPQGLPHPSVDPIHNLAHHHRVASTPPMSAIPSRNGSEVNVAPLTSHQPSHLSAPPETIHPPEVEGHGPPKSVANGSD